MASKIDIDNQSYSVYEMLFRCLRDKLLQIISKKLISMYKVKR